MKRHQKYASKNLLLKLPWSQLNSPRGWGRKEKHDGNNNPVYKTGKETLMYRTVFLLDCVGEGEGGIIWENGMETCLISYMK